MTELLVLLDNREVGFIRQQRGRARFTYADSWREAPGAYPLSLSMPMAARDHDPAAVEPFLWGLLPDNDAILARWAQRFQVSARNPVALLANVGADCAGAVQLIPPQRYATMEASGRDKTEWLSEAQIATRLRSLQKDASAWRSPGDIGQFSLAGAQPKTAFVFDGKRWGVPSGRTPTTHIFKPPVIGLDGHAENEHLCLAVARALGLPTARSQVLTFEDVAAIVIERYDRVRTAELATTYAAQATAKAAESAAHAAANAPNSAALAARSAAEAASAAADAQAMKELSRHTPVYRVHQEDLCQALRVHPTKKYQNQGGPGPIQIVELLRTHASGARRSGERGVPSAVNEDIDTFVDALILNFLLGGTDAHGKNYSILIGSGGIARLAPLYDIASIFAYQEMRADKAKLAMKVGSKYRLREITESDWRTLASHLRLDSDRIVARLRSMAAQIPDLIAAEARAMRKAGLKHHVIQHMARVLTERAGKYRTA
jgi:serine/threonine-protein kinase HipA